MFTGIIIGIGTFLIIGAFHPIVIKCEYHLGVRSWWLFLMAGLVALTGSLFTGDIIAQSLLGVVGFTCLWSIHEVFAQRRRVERGWFPQKPKKIERKK
jgi:hypothetical protein